MVEPNRYTFLSSRFLIPYITLAVVLLLLAILAVFTSNIFAGNDAVTTGQQAPETATIETTNAENVAATTQENMIFRRSTTLLDKRIEQKVPESEISSTTTPTIQKKPDNGKPSLHITFDDGPHQLTSYALEVLARHDVQATFFILGNRLEENPEIAKQILNAGHAIGNHSYKHDGWKTLGVAAAKVDVLKTQAVIENTLGVKPSCARAPFGDDSPEVVSMLNELGITHWEWDLDPKIWSAGRDERLRYMLDNPTSPPKLTTTDGYILLLHDSHESLKSSIDTLDSWLTSNKEKYQISAIPGCLQYQ